MKVALLCVGLDHVNRGFETFTRELFKHLHGRCPVHLGKGSGRVAPDVFVLPSLQRNAGFYQLWPFSLCGAYKRYRYDCLTFGWQFLWRLQREKYDVVLFSDQVLGEFLLWARRVFRLKFKLLLSNSAPWPPEWCALMDAVHQVSPAHRDAGIRAGIPAERTFLIPLGVDCARLQRPMHFDASAARACHGIPESAFVVLGLAALNSSHKRVDWLIQEFARLDPDRYFLVLAGSRETETPTLEKLAARELQRRNYKFLELPYTEVPALLWASDAFTLASLDEGFGRVIVEAMAAGLPLTLHPHPTAQWIVQDPNAFVDMTVPGALASHLMKLATDPGARVEAGARALKNSARFDWSVLTHDYLAMLETVHAL